MRFVVLVVAAIVASACGGKAEAVDAGADATTDGGSDGSTGSDANQCVYQETRSNADRACMVSGDCVVVVRSVTCCMEQHEGIRSDAAAKFQSDQAALTKGCPGCGCAAQPVDDSGMKGLNFTVTCDMGLCTSHAAP